MAQTAEILSKKIDYFTNIVNALSLELNDDVWSDVNRNWLDLITAMEEYASQDNWISVEDILPKILETVWVSNGKGFTTLGCRSDLYEDNGEMLWCWCQTNGIIYEDNGVIVSECESDDLDVNFWQPLPLPHKTN